MNLGGSLHLAWCYVLRHRAQTLLLAGALGVVLALPLGLRVVLNATGAVMRARAEATPQVIGGKGSALDLMLSALYFKRQPLPPLTMRTFAEVKAAGQGTAIPLYLRFHARQTPIVGTQLGYFGFRDLKLAEGRFFGRLGDCVVGAGVARREGLAPGGHVFSSQEQVFDLAGIYPLKMRVTGVLQPQGTADDEAVFVDLKTAWLIEGLAHGHEELKSDDAILSREEGNIVGNASVRLYNEVTEANIGSFHFHGDMAAYPLSAILVNPPDARAEALLAGRFLKEDAPARLIRPVDELESLMATLFQAESLVLGLLGLLAVAAFSVSGLVFALGFKLRRREFDTLADLGIPRTALVLTKSLEILMVSALAALLATGLTVLVTVQADAGVRLLLRS